MRREKSCRGVAALEPADGENVFRRTGEYWTIVYAGEGCLVADRLGLRYLAQLISRPGKESFALDLLCVVRGTLPACGGTSERAGADPVADVRARRAYRTRWNDIREELEDARAQNDLGRAARLRAEMEFLGSELTRTFGLGRLRGMGSPAERARVSVTRAIHGALARIDQYHPVLGRHFVATVHTGMFCVYRPDPRVSIEWIV